MVLKLYPFTNRRALTQWQNYNFFFSPPPAHVEPSFTHNTVFLQEIFKCKMISKSLHWHWQPFWYWKITISNANWRRWSSNDGTFLFSFAFRNAIHHFLKYQYKIADYVADLMPLENNSSKSPVLMDELHRLCTVWAPFWPN